MAHKRIAYLLALAAAAAFYIAHQEWFSWITLLAVLGFPWLSLLVSLPGILTLRVRAEGPDAIVPGQSGRIYLSGRSRFPVPPFSGRLRILRCTTGEQWIRGMDTDWQADHCGGLRIMPEKVKVYDYLGLFRFRVRKAEEKQILVRPAPVRMEAPPDLNRLLYRAWHPKPGGGYAENHELRPYRPGDSMNQIHWKLTAKTGKLTIREAMEPDLGRILLTMDIQGSAARLDEKFGRLLWMGEYLLRQNIPCELRVLTGDGLCVFPVAAEAELQKCIDLLLCCGPAAEGSVLDGNPAASWHCHIGGDSGEA